MTKFENYQFFYGYVPILDQIHTNRNTFSMLPPNKLSMIHCLFRYLNTGSMFPRVTRVMFTTSETSHNHWPHGGRETVAHTAPAPGLLAQSFVHGYGGVN